MSNILLDFLQHSFCRVLPIVSASNVFLFSIAQYTNVITYIDLGWVVNHFLIGTYYYNHYQGYKSLKGNLIYGLLIVWTLRLGSLMFSRVWKKHSDPRYEIVLSRFKNKTRGKFIHFQLQALFTVFTGSSFYFVFNNLDKLKFSSSFFLMGTGMVLMGIIGEAIADAQIEKFKKKIKKNDTEKKENTTFVKKGLYREGLWKNARHPNLFFEFVTWFGFGLLGMRIEWYTFASFLAPFILCLIVNGASVPITEKMMKGRREETVWKEYVDSTNKYVPLKFRAIQ